MSLQELFMPQDNTSDDASNVIDLPKSYRKTVSWSPKLGDIAPNITCQSTHGRIDFHTWAEGMWTVVCSYPLKRAGVSDTELVGMEMQRGEFEERGAQVLGITPCGLNTNINWLAEVGELFNTSIKTPLVCDERGEICSAMGAQHENAPFEPTVRKTMIFDPAMRLRWVSEYPSNVGRSVEEILRVLDALQLFDTQELGTPMDWIAGEPAIVPPTVSTATARKKYGDSVNEVTPRIRTVIPLKK
ncbi:redoxin domain-containing protein [Roseovarius pelagicus]|uniref:Alkyl hydroperoxide reductase C n=1 Tax=Roseovarius pelagicus TaxID=2980108 RepID=A0ABY6DF55_9RHOB|nr:redoxin domain-containing protein [Roseovarius pelagicus]UXX84700.1 redoxin domain-containing protein [Roseovarius pelagicus]